MKRALLNLLWMFSCVTALAPAQAVPSAMGEVGRLHSLTAGDSLSFTAPAVSPPVLARPAALPPMVPELALQVFEGRSILQTEQLASYSATMLISAQLPDSSQYGEYELQKHYAAPGTLVFQALRFAGDNFIKTNVIVRLLRSEVEHTQRDDPALTAITPANYIFSYKGTSQLEGRSVHVYQLKPRRKRSGLFKGRIHLDACTGSLMRAEGRLVKSPSFFVKKIDFVQDFADINSFTFPVHIHSEAQTRLVGRVVVDIYQHDYQPVATPLVAEGYVDTIFLL